MDVVEYTIVFFFNTGEFRQWLDLHALLVAQSSFISNIMKIVVTPLLVSNLDIYTYLRRSKINQYK